MDTELTVDQIISDEIKQYRVIQKSNTQSVSDLIKSSAKKLADSGVIEQNQISRVLKSRFSDHKRWVEKVLPDEYKLTTKPKQEEIRAYPLDKPPTIFERMPAKVKTAMSR